MTLQDKDYLEKIKQCLVRLGDTQGVQKVTDLWLNTVEEAERIHQQQKVEEAERIRRLQDEKLRLLREQAEEQARQKLLEEETTNAADIKRFVI